MEEFAQSSGEHGVVVFSLGSMIRNITQERANTIASALAQIPQKVRWCPHGRQLSTEFINIWKGLTLEGSFMKNEVL